jgi:hypothetical protein
MVGSATAATLALASFTSSATASQSISSRNLVAPASLTATPSGHDVTLAWPAGSNGNGYQLLAVANGTSANCTSATFAALATSAALSYTDTGRSAPQGTYECYQVRTTYNTWTSVTSNPTAVAQLGVVATSIQAANGGTAGTLGPGDTITITYNQPITTTTGPSASDTVCAINGTTIMLATTTTTGTCATTETLDLGKLTGGSSNKNARWSATYTWSNNNTTLTIKLVTLTSGTNPTSIGTWTLNPTTTTTKILSTTGSFHTCDTNTSGGNCLPTVTGSF